MIEDILSRSLCVIKCLSRQDTKIYSVHPKVKRGNYETNPPQRQDYFYYYNNCRNVKDQELELEHCFTD